MASKRIAIFAIVLPSGLQNRRSASPAAVLTKLPAMDTTVTAPVRGPASAPLLSTESVVRRFTSWHAHKSASFSSCT
jgi:hypothetical protein